MPFLYVIMPVGGDPQADSKKAIIAQAAHELGVDVILPQYSLIKPTFQLDYTIEMIEKCDFALADLSFERPSCYYELGLVEARKKDVVIVAKVGTDIHQTWARNRVHEYKTVTDYPTVTRSALKSLLASR